MFFFAKKNVKKAVVGISSSFPCQHQIWNIAVASVACCTSLCLQLCQKVSLSKLSIRLPVPFPPATKVQLIPSSKSWHFLPHCAFSPQRFIASNRRRPRDVRNVAHFSFKIMPKAMCRNACIFNTISPPLWGHLVHIYHLTFPTPWEIPTIDAPESSISIT